MGKKLVWFAVGVVVVLRSMHLRTQKCNGSATKRNVYLSEYPIGRSTPVDVLYYSHTHTHIAQITLISVEQEFHTQCTTRFKQKTNSPANVFGDGGCLLRHISTILTQSMAECVVCFYVCRVRVSLYNNVEGLWFEHTIGHWPASSSCCLSPMCVCVIFELYKYI